MSIPQSGGGPIQRPQELAEYLEKGCKPADQWRIGTEHEKFGFLTDTREPLPYDGPRSVRAILDGLAARGWEPLRESGAVIGLKKGKANVSLEPGGQLELSGAPVANVHETAAELDSHLAEVRAIAEPLGVAFMGIGAA